MCAQHSSPPIGQAQTLAHGLRRIIAPNPGPMTFWGTNTYLLGSQCVAVIDPGPDDPAHLSAIRAAVGRGRVEAVLLTHSHLDHSPLAWALGAPVLAFGDSRAGRSAVMARLAAAGLTQGGEGIDADFAPDRCLADGAQIACPEWSLTALHTPGHMGNHMCFAWGDRLFSGDHLMGWSSSLVSPPDGDLTDFMASTRRLAQSTWRTAYPGHGAPIEAPGARLGWLLQHRLDREAQVLAALEALQTLPALVRQVYTDVPLSVLPAAARNLFAHLVDLHCRGLVKASPELSEAARFEKI